MAIRWRGPFPWLAGAFVANAAAVILAARALAAAPLTGDSLTALTLVALAGAALLFVVAWKVIDALVMRTLRRMATEVRAIAYGGDRPGLDPAAYAMLSPLPEAVNEICARMMRAKTELASGLATATRRAEDNAQRLAAILNDLQEGVVVCTQRHELVLYNTVAFDLLGPTADLGLGRSLFETLAREPVVRTIERLGADPDGGGRGVPFLVGTVEGRLLLQARMSLIRAGGGALAGYVVTLVDAAPQLASLSGREALRREIAAGIEAPLERIAAALADAPAVEAACHAAGQALRRAVAGYDRLLAGWWPSGDLLSTDLLSDVRDRLDTAPAVTVVGLPVWLHAEPYSLTLALEDLVRHVAAHTGAGAFDLSAGRDGEAAWIEIRWPTGPSLPAVAMERWLDLTLAALGGLTARALLPAGPNGEGGPACGADEAGGGWVRLPVEPARASGARSGPPLPARPEFHDLGLLELPRDTGDLGTRPLKSLDFVVFDTETTGLAPSQGDRIVSIAGVRIVNGRILSGESFSRVIHPGRPIPPESVRFHGITDAMVQDKPPARVVLPQFRAYVAGAVMVAHNAAFDLKFLEVETAGSAVRFDGPVLDTMILSDFLDGPDAGHSLDAICARYGIPLTDRHTALGDAMATAAVLLCQLDALEGRGILTLDQAARSLDLARVLHERQRVL
ncbi:3'-5' exonuclease [Phaeospirillum tilakii]|uniref:DNA-directed DNA polymerase n=1 Tax=Phaeospirillum tilakii TaxID=741673 RepID=A0ABW5CER0_9PROT